MKSKITAILFISIMLLSISAAVGCEPPKKNDTCKPKIIYIEKIVYKDKIVYVDRPVYINQTVEVIKYVDRIVEVPIYINQTVEVIKYIEVPIEIIKYVNVTQYVPVEVIKEVPVYLNNTITEIKTVTEFIKVPVNVTKEEVKYTEAKTVPLQHTGIPLNLALFAVVVILFCLGYTWYNKKE
jgi:hypothetical protein